jgi:hypothetical protein
MESFTLFESTVIGFFSGVVASTYIAFVDSTGRYLGSVLDWVSLRPIVNTIATPDEKPLVFSFLLIVAVYTLYGLLVGALIKKSKKFKVSVITIIIVLVASILFQQVSNSAQISVAPEFNNSANEISSKTPARDSGQYFGNEVVGDLNNDGKNDVAFILARDYTDGTKSYYLSVALTTSNGHTGTNVISLGEKMELQKISINYGIIGVTYLDQVDNKTKTAYARINKGILESIKASDGSVALMWGEIIYNEKVQTFKPCGSSGMLWLTASSGLLKTIDAAQKAAASQVSPASSTIFGALVGKIVSAPTKGVGAGYKGGFSATEAIALVPNGVCQ